MGKRRLDQALADAGIGDAEIHWHAFQLNPDLPPEGMDRQEYMRRKFGDPANVARIHERVEAAGKSAGIAFRFDLIQRSPNTFDAHRLLKLAAEQGRQQELKDALMRAYFLEGRDVGDRATLVAIAAATGLAGDIAAWLAGEGGKDAVRADLAGARQLGISGVPFFIFAGQYALAGAQPPEIFAQAFTAARNATASASPIG